MFYCEINFTIRNWYIKNVFSLFSIKQLNKLWKKTFYLPCSSHYKLLLDLQICIWVGINPAKMFGIIPCNPGNYYNAFGILLSPKVFLPKVTVSLI